MERRTGTIFNKAERASRNSVSCVMAAMLKFSLTYRHMLSSIAELINYQQDHTFFLVQAGPTNSTFAYLCFQSAVRSSSIEVSPCCSLNALSTSECVESKLFVTAVAKLRTEGSLETVQNKNGLTNAKCIDWLDKSPTRGAGDVSK